MLFLVLVVAAGAWWWRRKRDLEFARLQREPDAPLDSPAAPWSPGAGLQSDGEPAAIEANSSSSTADSAAEAIASARSDASAAAQPAATRPLDPPRMRATQNGAESGAPASLGERPRGGGRPWGGASLPPPTAIKPPVFRAGPPSGSRHLP